MSERLEHNAQQAPPSTTPPVRLPPLKREAALSRDRRGGIIWAAIVSVAVALAIAAAVFYGYPALRRNQDLLGRIPGFEQFMAATGPRVDALEERLKKWDLDRESMSGRLDTLERRMQSATQAARKQAQEIQSRLEVQLNSRMEGMQARLSSLEQAQQADRARMARLQQDLETVRQDTDRRLAGLREDTGRDVAGLQRQVADLNVSSERGRRDFESLAAKTNRNLDRERLDFEVGKGKSLDVAPGVTLHVTSADPRYRRVNGWIWLMPDRRTLWLRNQGAQQPVTFYQKHDNRPVQLVLTQVAKNSVAGYVLMPVGAAASAPAAGAGE